MTLYRGLPIVPHWKALRYGKDGPRQLSCGSISSICQAILKSDNLLHKWGFVDSQSLRTVVKQSASIDRSELS